MDIERDEDKPDPTIFFEVGYDPREKGVGLDKKTKDEIEAKEQEDLEAAGDDVSSLKRKKEANNHKNRHYRKYYNKELEKETDVMGESPFLHENIYRVKKVNSGFFGFGGSTNPNDFKPVCTGRFKGLV